MGQTMNPVVAVTTWKRSNNTFLGPDTPNHTLIADYASELEQAGAIALLVARLEEDEVGAVLDRVDGVVITGGGDIDPDQYRKTNTDSTEIDRAADRRDIALVRGARERTMPLLGICRGLQAVNVAFGGELHQYALADTSAAHPTLSERPEVRNAHRHSIEIAQDSRLAKIYGTTKREVNSLHHQAVSILGEGIRAVAWASDGHIEAAESESDWPVLCVQWHPELLHEPTEGRLFSAFVEDARSYRDR